MTFTLAHGPLGVKGIHTWNAGVVLNDRTTTTRGPRVFIDKVTGLRKRPDADDLREPNVGRPGETPRRGFKRGKTLVYEGRLQAPSELELYALREQLVEAFQIDETGTMLIEPHADVGGPGWRYTAKVLDCDIDDSVVRPATALPTPWEWPITLTVRMADARFYLDDAVDVASVAADGTVATVNQPGRADTDPTIVVTLPDTAFPIDVRIANTSVHNDNGADGILLFHLLPHTVSLVVNFAARTAVATLGIFEYDARSRLDVPGSTWWDEFVPGLAPGDNDVNAQVHRTIADGGAAVAGGSWTATFRPATW